MVVYSCKRGSIEIERKKVCVVVNFLSQVIFVFLFLFLGMVMYANEFERKEKEKLPELKN